jgi:hypothetical protein
MVGTTSVLNDPRRPNWRVISTFCTSTSETADTESSCAISRGKTSVLQLFTDPRSSKRKIYEKFLAIISFGIFKFFHSENFYSTIPVLIKLETKRVNLVLSVFRSNVRKAGNEMYHFTSSENFKVIESDSK